MIGQFKSHWPKSLLVGVFTAVGMILLPEDRSPLAVGAVAAGATLLAGSAVWMFKRKGQELK